MSINNKKLVQVFSSALNIDEHLVNDGLMYNSIEQWDSTAHMTLIAELEDEFDVMLDTDDIIEMNSVGKSREILIKYGIGFSID